MHQHELHVDVKPLPWQSFLVAKNDKLVLKATQVFIFDQDTDAREYEVDFLLIKEQWNDSLNVFSFRQFNEI